MHHIWCKSHCLCSASVKPKALPPLLLKCRFPNHPFYRSVKQLGRQVLSPAKGNSTLELHLGKCPKPLLSLNISDVANLSREICLSWNSTKKLGAHVFVYTPALQCFSHPVTPFFGKWRIININLVYKGDSTVSRKITLIIMFPLPVRI